MRGPPTERDAESDFLEPLKIYLLFLVKTRVKGHKVDTVLDKWCVKHSETIRRRSSDVNNFSSRPCRKFREFLTLFTNFNQ